MHNALLSLSLFPRQHTIAPTSTPYHIAYITHPSTPSHRPPNHRPISSLARMLVRSQASEPGNRRRKEGGLSGSLFDKKDVRSIAEQMPVVDKGADIFQGSFFFQKNRQSSEERHIQMNPTVSQAPQSSLLLCYSRYNIGKAKIHTMNIVILF